MPEKTANDRIQDFMEGYKRLCEETDCRIVPVAKLLIEAQDTVRAVAEVQVIAE